MMRDYYLVVFDDRKGNTDTEGKNKNGIVYFLKKEKFVCKAGFWGCPWYFIDIENKTFLPGRPGVAYGKVNSNRYISFDEFQAIYHIYMKSKGVII